MARVEDAHHNINCRTLLKLGDKGFGMKMLDCIWIHWMFKFRFGLSFKLSLPEPMQYCYIIWENIFEIGKMYIHGGRAFHIHGYRI